MELLCGFSPVVLWGFIGSRYARFGSFAFGPSDVLAYLKGTVSGEGKRYVGHNPGSSVAIWAMLALTLGLGVSGSFMSTNEVLEEVHEILAYALLVVVITHVLGVLWHMLRHRENLAASMVTGYKEGEPTSAIPSVHPLAAAIFLALTAVWAGLLMQGYDGATRTVTLPVLGTQLQLGEGPEGGGERQEAGHAGNAGDEAEDHDDD